MMDRGSADLWKQAAIFLSAILISAFGSWVAFGRNSISKADVQNLIAVNSPYAQDRGGIATHFMSLDQEIAALQTDHSNMNTRLNNIAERLSALEATVLDLENLTSGINYKYLGHH